MSVIYISMQWRRLEFSFGGYSPGGLGNGSPQWGPGAKPWYGVWGQSPPEAVLMYWSSLQTSFADFDCRNDQNL